MKWFSRHLVQQGAARSVMIFLKQNEKQPYCKLDAGHTSLADAAKINKFL
jgi:hypothetical protein